MIVLYYIHLVLDFQFLYGEALCAQRYFVPGYISVISL